MWKYAFVAALVFAASAFGQRRFELSVKLGIPITGTFQSGSWDYLATGLQQGVSATRRYTGGVGAVLRLPRGFAAEADVLYKRLGFDINSTSDPAVPFVLDHTWNTGNSLEFPMLGEYRLERSRLLMPHIGAGVSVRTVAGASTTGQCYSPSQYYQWCPSAVPYSQPVDPHFNARSHFGGVVAGGIERRAGFLRLSPEIRYSRWRADSPVTAGGYTLRSNPNQVDFLLGLNF